MCAEKKDNKACFKNYIRLTFHKSGQDSSRTVTIKAGELYPLEWISVETEFWHIYEKLMQ